MKRANHYWKRWNKTWLGLGGIFVFSLMLGGLIWHLSHKPRGDIARQPSSSASACVPVLTQDESHTLLMNLSQINQDYFSGQLTEEKRDLNLTELFRQLNPEQSPKRAGWINAEVALNNEKEISAFIAGLTFKQMSGQSISDQENAVLEDLQVSDPQGYVDDSVLRTESYYETLRAHGARYDAATQAWDLSRLKLNTLSLQEQPGVFLAIATLFSPVLAASLLEPNRREAVIHNDWVFFPPIKSGSQGALPEGEIAIWSLSKYQTAVKRDLEFFSATLKNFLLASERMTTFSHIFRGIGQEGLYRYINPNLKIAGSDMTGEEFAYVTYREHLSGTAYRLIFDYGVPGELKDKLFETIDQASNIDDQNRHTQIEKIKLIRKAVIALAALPVVVYFAPAAGGLISAKMATFVGSSAAVMALMPMAFGAGLAIVNASIYQQRYGGDWFCHFAEEMTEKGLGSFYMAPYMAAIPVGAALAAAAPMAGAAAADSLAGTLVGAYAAPVIYGGLNIGVALYFVQDMGRHGYTGLSDCQSKIKKMYDLAQDDGASEAHLNMLLTEGMAQCAQGGFDIAFALSGGSTLAVRGYRGARHIREAQTQRQAQVAKVAEVKQRMAKAKHVLMRELTPAEQDAVQRAHEVGSGQPGRDGRPAAINNYTEAQLREKARILDEAGFKTAERRKLIEAGVVGEPVSELRTLFNQVKTGTTTEKVEAIRQLGKLAMRNVPEHAGFDRRKGLEPGRNDMPRNQEYGIVQAALMDFLKSPDDIVRGVAIQELGNMRSEHAVASLLGRALRHKDQGAIEALKKIRPEKVPELDLLAKAVRDIGPEAHSEYADIIEQILRGNQNAEVRLAVTGVLDLVKSPEVQNRACLLALESWGQPYVQLKAIEVLGQMEHVPENLHYSLIHVYESSPHKLVRNAASATLGALGKKTNIHPADLASAVEILGRRLKPGEGVALQKAHIEGLGERGRNGGPAGIGNYTEAQLREKARILDDAGFTPAERRQLIEAGVVGEFNADPKAADFYDRLGVPRDASPELIRRAFHDAASKFHPDKASGSEMAMRGINEANDTLSNPKRRETYDTRPDGGRHAVSTREADHVDVYLAQTRVQNLSEVFPEDRSVWSQNRYEQAKRGERKDIARRRQEELDDFVRNHLGKSRKAMELERERQELERRSRSVFDRSDGSFVRSDADAFLHDSQQAALRARQKVEAFERDFGMSPPTNIESFYKFIRARGGKYYPHMDIIRDHGHMFFEQGTTPLHRMRLARTLSDYWEAFSKHSSPSAKTQEWYTDFQAFRDKLVAFELSRANSQEEFAALSREFFDGINLDPALLEAYKPLSDWWISYAREHFLVDLQWFRETLHPNSFPNQILYRSITHPSVVEGLKAGRIDVPSWRYVLERHFKHEDPLTAQTMNELEAIFKQDSQKMDIAEIEALSKEYPEFDTWLDGIDPTH